MTLQAVLKAPVVAVQDLLGLEDFATAASVCWVTFATAFVVLRFVYRAERPRGAALRAGDLPKKEPDPPRNFTIEQLHEFNGTDEATAAYVALRGEVFDVSEAPQHYKKGGAYNVFAGRDASVNLATLSFEEQTLDSKDWGSLGAGERDALDGWVEKFRHYSGYPVVGRVVTPPEPREFTREELKAFTGEQEVPEGYAAAPIYVGVKGKVYDMSFGGVVNYGPGKTYHLFAGRDASVALAKMSFDKALLEEPDMSTLSESDLEVLDDWASKLAKKYPVVGIIKA